MGQTTLRIALAQFDVGADIADILRAARQEGASIVVFPEMYSNGYSRFSADEREAWIATAVTLGGDYIERFRAEARLHDIAVVATFLERGEPKPFNTAVLIDRRGDIVLQQRKRHICFFDVPEEACAAGVSSEVVRLKTEHGPVAVGIMICMDREFPDVGTDLVRGGAEIVLVPNSCRLVEDAEVGDVRLAGIRAMAFQSVAGVAVANYPEPKDDGHSVAVGPSGEVVVLGGRAPELVMADFDITAIRAAQAREWFRRAR
ncbi:MAG TPA: carbon-nitrogen hydrolase family protein [Ensifer sp.]|nr:carbon-nitrogen hydrolase family protein [Ensifer sp.]